MRTVATLPGNRQQFNGFHCKTNSCAASTSSDSDSSCSSLTTSSSTSSVRRGRVFKPSHERRERRKVMEKLQKMVPAAKEGDSQLKLLQDIMDYILCLQRQLQDSSESDTENDQQFSLDIAALSEMFTRFSTKADRIPLHSGQRLMSH